MRVGANLGVWSLTTATEVQHKFTGPKDQGCEELHMMPYPKSSRIDSGRSKLEKYTEPHKL